MKKKYFMFISIMICLVFFSILNAQDIKKSKESSVINFITNEKIRLEPKQVEEYLRTGKIPDVSNNKKNLNFTV